MGSEATAGHVEPASPADRTARAGLAGATGRLVAGRYRLVTLIGAGAMGAVWLARDETLDVDVALKEIRPPFAIRDGDAGADADDEAGLPTAVWVARALNEARSAAQLRANPHVVTVHDAVLDGGSPWIVMEAVAARSLQEAVEDDGPRPLADVARIGLAVLDALVAGQRLGVVHRDVKPSNILLAHDGRVLLTDFGIAASATDPTLTQQPLGDALPSGTPAYLAPERLRGGPATLTADLFALGATLFFAADGVAPFHLDSLLATLHAVLYDEPEPTRDIGPLAPVIGGLLAKDPAQRLRPAGAEALLARALRQLGSGEAPAGRPPDLASAAPVLTPAPAPRRPPSSVSPAGAPEPPAASEPPAAASADAGARPSSGSRRGPVSRPGSGFRSTVSRPRAAAAGDSPGAARPAEAAGSPGSRPGAAVPVPLGELGPDLAGPDGAPPRRRPSMVPVPLGAVTVVAVLLVAGLAAWGVGLARDGSGRASPPATSSSAAVTSGAVAPSGGAAPSGGTVPGSGRGSAGASTGADAGVDGVPVGMAGRWRGTVTQGVETYGVAPGGVTFTVPPVRFDVTLDIRGGAVGATVGTSSSSEGCVADLVLRETGIGQIRVQEVTTRSNAQCVGVYRLQLTLNDDGTLSYAYDATLVYSAGLATLTRV